MEDRPRDDLKPNTALDTLEKVDALCRLGYPGGPAPAGCYFKRWWSEAARNGSN